MKKHVLFILFVLLFKFISFGANSYFGIISNLGFSSYSYYSEYEDEYSKFVLPRVNRGIGFNHRLFIGEENKISLSYSIKYDTRGYLLNLDPIDEFNKEIREKMIFKIIEFPMIFSVHSENILHIFKPSKIKNIFKDDQFYNPYVS
ncbi:MAG: hypothetical protein AB8B61_02600, partial [Cyclobacteriaceae bacterium]